MGRPSAAPQYFLSFFYFTVFYFKLLSICNDPLYKDLQQVRPNNLLVLWLTQLSALQFVPNANEQPLHLIVLANDKHGIPKKDPIDPKNFSKYLSQVTFLLKISSKFIRTQKFFKNYFTDYQLYKHDIFSCSLQTILKHHKE